MYISDGVCISGWIGTVRGVVDILHVPIKPNHIPSGHNKYYQNLDSTAHFP